MIAFDTELLPEKTAKARLMSALARRGLVRIALECLFLREAPIWSAGRFRLPPLTLLDEAFREAQRRRK